MSRKEKEIQARKDDILDTAAMLFSEKDFHEVTVDEIADRVGLSKGTLYLYFKNKEDLFFSIVSEKTNRLLERLKSAVAGNEPYLVRLENLVQTYLGFFEEHRPFFKIIHCEKSRVGNKVGDRLKKHIMNSFQDYIQILLEFTKEGQIEGVLRNLSPLTLAKTLRGIMDSFTFYWVFMGGEGPLVNETHQIMDLFLNGTKVSDK